MRSNDGLKAVSGLLLALSSAVVLGQERPPPPAVAGQARAIPVVVVDTPPAPVAADPAPAIDSSPAATLATPGAPAVLKQALQLKASDARFPRYEVLKPAVDFWTRVFGEYSELQSVVHFPAYPQKVVRVLDFRSDAQRLDRFQLEKLRSQEEKAAKAAVDQLLEQVHAKQYAPETMSYEERRLYDLLADVPGEDRYLRLRGTVRSQRGLRERTLQALETSDHYLPEMERIFAGYNLPAPLTRIPLVESSFNIEAYSKSGAAGIWQFIPSSARIYMRLNDVVDDRRDPWTATDGAARHLRDDYKLLQDWPLAITAYNHGRNGIARGLKETGGRSLIDLIRRYDNPRFGFAGKNYYAEFLAAVDVEAAWRQRRSAAAKDPIEFEVVETRHYVPYDTLRRLCGADDSLFRRLNPAYRPEVIEGKLFVPPGHLIRVPAGKAQNFEVAYARLGTHERFEAQRVQFLLHRVKKGEVLGRIAKRYGTTQSAILRANGLSDPRKLRVGQVLKVPPHRELRPGPITVAVGESKASQTREQRQAEQGERKAPSKSTTKKKKSGPVFKVHRVRAGQTLHSIAQRYDTTVSELRAANNLGSSSVIRTGQKLKVPVAS